MRSCCVLSINSIYLGQFKFTLGNCYMPKRKDQTTCWATGLGSNLSHKLASRNIDGDKYIYRICGSM